jgi:hypothetical protein
MLFTSCVLGATEFDTYRLLQLEEHGRINGSQSSLLNFPAVHFTDNVYRNVAVIHLRDLYDGVIEKIINTKPFGLLILLPESD